MADSSKIEWTDATWNPVTGCTKVSPGCDHCYAERVTERFHGKGSFATVTLHEDRLEQPLRWRTPRRVFVNSMSDLFHQDVPDEYIARVWQVMATTPRHTYQILTKRPARMRAWINRCKVSPGGWITHDGTDPRGAYDGSGLIVGHPEPAKQYDYRGPRGGKPRHKPQPVAYGWPLPNVWLGVSVENQQWADIRIPALLETPAAVRFLSCEPLLGPLNLMHEGWLLSAIDRYEDRGVGLQEWCPEPGGIDWVIAGGESGPGARPMHPDWARQLRDQCARSGVPYFFKQWGEWAPNGWRGIGNFDPKRERLVGEPLDDAGHREVIERVGKKAAGRLLDGRTWDEYPLAPLGGRHG